jgi:NAD(P)-dependent dehydrogenase (short-subunit alcohol dehydrogenase family)
MFGIEGKVIVVTGSATGIGRVVAEAMVKFGAKVIAADTNPEVSRAFGASHDPPRAHAVVGDVSKAEDAERIVGAAIDHFGGCDVLVNCAGISVLAAAVDMLESDWDRILAVNLTGTFLCSRAAARYMRDHNGGSIINFTSQVAEVALPTRSAYIASKGGVRALTKALALEFAPYRIRVNAIAPGPIEVDRTRANLHDPQYRHLFMSRMLLGRLGTPEDIIGPAVFLASAASSFMTGSTVLVDGGYLTT